MARKTLLPASSLWRITSGGGNSGISSGEHGATECVWRDEEAAAFGGELALGFAVGSGSWLRRTGGFMVMEWRTLVEMAWG